jgi:adenosylcobinamide-GDP ribazoletransferase
MPDGLRLALTTFTVLPLRAGRVDRAAAGVAMLLAPLVGALLGLVLAGAAYLLRSAHVPGVVLGAVVVGLGALLTRGLHLDGLADTVDGLGSYAGRERALEIMRGPEVGPFGVVALVLVLLVQAGSVASLVGTAEPRAYAALPVALATGRLAALAGCVRGVPAARPDGLGALVAGSVGRVPVALAVLAVVAAAVLAGPVRGPVAVLGGLGAALLLLRHARRRLGGVTGDVLGALVEVAQTVALVVLAAR